MYRAIPVANRACADRVQSRNQQLHRERIKKMRPQVDTAEPKVIHMDHRRNNLKREQMLEERYYEIDRENRILLQKMSDMMKQSGHTPRAKSGPPSLNRDARKTQLMQITKENQSILKRIQQAQPVYNHVAWEDSYRRSYAYLKNSSEYPVVLKRKSSQAGSLTPLPQSGAGSRAESRAPGEGGALTHSASGVVEDRYVFKEGKRIGQRYYLVEMATDGRTLAVSAFDGDQQRTLELVINERNHRRLYREHNGDYSLIADKLRVESDQLTVDLSGGPLDGRPDSGGGRQSGMAATM